MRFLREAIAILALAFEIGLMSQAWPHLPARVPMHFAADGRPDAYGPATALLALPVLSFAIYVLLTAISFAPQRFNYPVPVTNANRARVHAIAVAMMGWLKAEVMCVFAYVTSIEVDAGTAVVRGLGWAFLPVTLAVIGLTILIGLVATRRAA